MPKPIPHGKKHAVLGCYTCAHADHRRLGTAEDCCGLRPRPRWSKARLECEGRKPIPDQKPKRQQGGPDAGEV